MWEEDKRRFEGYEMVERSIELAMVFRAKVNWKSKNSVNTSIVLTVKDFIPDQYRDTGLTEYYDSSKGWNRMEEGLGKRRIHTWSH